MIKSILTSFKNLEDITYRIMKKGIDFSFIISLISGIILLIYELFFPSPAIYYIGLSLFKLSIYFIIEFIVCGFVVDNIKKGAIK